MKERSKEFLQAMARLHKIKAYHKPTLPHGEFTMLFIIEQYEAEKQLKKITITKLSERMRASKPAVSKMIGHLEQKEFVKRTISKSDRRVVFVELTEKGLHALNQSKLEIDLFLTKILERLGEMDAVELIRIINKMNDICYELFLQKKNQKDEK